MPIIGVESRLAEASALGLATIVELDAATSGRERTTLRPRRGDHEGSDQLDTIQSITDDLATSLNRAVYTEDASFHPLAASAQVGTIDDARVEALLSRKPTERHLEYFGANGVLEAREPIRVPASAYHGLLARVMIPITAQGRVLARIWLVDADPRVADEEIARVVHRSRAMRSDLLERRDNTRQRVSVGSNLLQRLRRTGRDRRRALLTQLRSVCDIGDLTRTRVCVIRFPAATHASQQTPGEDDALLADLLETFVERLGQAGVAGCTLDDGLLALAATEGTLEAMLEDVMAAARRASTLHAVPLTAVGVGGALRTSDGFDPSLRQARFAARIATAVPDIGGIACWDDLGEYRLFYGIDWSLDGVASISPGVATLITEHRTPLAATLLAYLEREADVNATATELRVHRTTLYYRIQRATEVLGEEPTGPARFRIHAALRLARVAGLCTPVRRL